MTVVLWVLAVPSLAFGGLAYRSLPGWFDGRDLTPTLLTSVLGTGLALVGGLLVYGAWQRTRALAARIPAAPAPSFEWETLQGEAAAHPEGDASLVEAHALADHGPAYRDLAHTPDPGRLLLGPLYRHAATGFHLDAVYAVLFVRPVQAGASLVRFLDSAVVDTYVRGAAALPRLLGAAVRRAQTGNVQTYVSALLAGTVVLAVVVLLVATGA